MYVAENSAVYDLNAVQDRHEFTNKIYGLHGECKDLHVQFCVSNDIIIHAQK